MAISAIRLENFMPFEDSGWMEIRPITLLFGKNASGKSSILRALRLIALNLHSMDGKFHLRSSNNKQVDVGSYRTAIHKHEPWRTMRFSFRFEQPNATKELNTLPNFAKVPSQTLIEVTLGYNTNPNILGGELTEFSFGVVQEDEAVSFFSGTRILEGQTIPPEDNEESFLYFDDLFEWAYATDIEEVESLNWDLLQVRLDQLIPQIESAEGRPVHYQILNQVISQLIKDTHDFFDNVQYVSPLRPNPERIYEDSTIHSYGQVGLVGFEAYLSRDLSRDPDPIKLNKWLQQLGFGDSIEIEHPSILGNDHWVGTIDTARITISTDKLKITIKDTGSGIAQALPIILECLSPQLDTENKILFIEQPELHLHPSAQAILTNLLVATAIPQHPKPKNILIIETHSENVLLRLRRFIVETESKVKNIHAEQPHFTRDDFCVVFIEKSNENSSSVIHRLEIDLYGNFISTPNSFNSFFTDDRRELLAINEAIKEDKDDIW